MECFIPGTLIDTRSPWPLLLKYPDQHLPWDHTSSLVDVILTNQPQFYFNAINFDNGICDCYNLTGVVIKVSTARSNKWRIKYRSFKNFNPEQFNDFVSKSPFMQHMRSKSVMTSIGLKRCFLLTLLMNMLLLKNESLNLKRPAFSAELFFKKAHAF